MTRGYPAPKSSMIRVNPGEMLCSNPDAFRSEMDVETMMSHFPHRF